MTNNKDEELIRRNGNEDRELVMADLLSQMASGDTPLSTSDTEETLESKLDQLSDDELQQLIAVGRFVRTLDDVCQSNVETHGNDQIDSRLAKETSLVSDRPASTDSPIQRIGKYTIVSLAGQGGFAKVYKAIDEDLQRIVAIKVPHADKLRTARLRERFRREGRAAALLTHDGIVTAYDAGTQDGIEYICYAWVDGTDLGSWLANREQSSATPLPFDEITAALLHLADAMGYAHSRQILHRDIKPANILVESLEGRPWYECLRVADFGLVRELDALPTLTHDGEVMGTPAYMSPEQVRCESTLGPPSDVYALGALMYELLTGDPPHLRSNYATTLLAIENDAVAPISSHRQDVPRDLQAICMKCLEFDSDKRYKHASELNADLVRFRDGNPVAARPVGAVGKCLRWSKRNPLVAGSLCTALVTLLVGLAVTGWLLNRTINDNRRIVQSQQETQRLSQSNEQALDSILGSFRRVNPESGGQSELKAHEVLDAARVDIESKFVAEPLTKGRLLSELGEAYESLGLYAQGVQCHQLSLDLFDKLAGPLAPVTIRELQLLAQAQMNSGQLAESLDSHNELLKRAGNDFDQAEKIARTSELGLLELQLRSGQTLDTIGALAASSKDFEDEESQLRLQLLTQAYRGKGSRLKAIEVSRSFWEYRELNNGDSAIETLLAKRQYVLALADAKQFGKALPLSESLIESLVRVAGADSIAVLEQRELNGRLLFNAGKIELAQSVAAEALALGAKRYGPTHSTIVGLKRLQAHCYRSKNNLDESIRVLREAWASQHVKSKALSPAFWNVAIDLSTCYRLQNKPNEAVELLKPLHQPLNELDTVETHEVIRARGELIRAYSESGDAVSAIPLAELRIRDFGKRTRFEGVFVRFAKLDLIHVLMQANEFESAVTEARGLIDHWHGESLENSAFAGVSGKPILKAKCLLAISLAETGDFVAAEKAARDALNDPHLMKPYNQLMMCVLASSLSNKGDHENAAIMRYMTFGLLNTDVFPAAEFNMRHLILILGETIYRQAEAEGNSKQAEFSKAAIDEMRAEMYMTK